MNVGGIEETPHPCMSSLKYVAQDCYLKVLAKSKCRGRVGSVLGLTHSAIVKGSANYSISNRSVTITPFTPVVQGGRLVMCSTAHNPREALDLQRGHNIHAATLFAPEIIPRQDHPESHVAL